MSKKLTKTELKSKKKYHEKRAEYYQKKIEKIEWEENRIGFKW